MKQQLFFSTFCSFSDRLYLRDFHSHKTNPNYVERILRVSVLSILLTLQFCRFSSEIIIYYYYTIVRARNLDAIDKSVKFG